MMFGGKSWSSLLLESHVHSASYFSEVCKYQGSCILLLGMLP